MPRRRPESGTPTALIPPALIAVAFLALPVLALLTRAPWSRLVDIYRHADATSGVDVPAALALSMGAAVITTIVSVILGVPLAWMLARVTFPGRAIVRALVTLPLVLPPVVGGLALLISYGRRGIVGGPLYDVTGASVAFTPIAVVMAQTFVAMPFLIVTVEGALRGGAREVEEMALTLGASRWQTFVRVTLPLIRPSLLAGMVLCWARALGEFGATVLFAGNVVRHTQTAPTGVLTAFQSSPEEAVALSLPMMLVALVILIALRDRWLRQAVPA